MMAGVELTMAPNGCRRTNRIKPLTSHVFI